MFARYLFGPDVFISYARSDGARYALALATSLSAVGLSCFMDQWDSVPDRRVPPRVLRALKRSSLLVLVGTPSASISASVLEEVRAFKRTHRNIVPIDIMGALRSGPLADEISGLALIVEEAEALRQEKPSAIILPRVQGAANFRRHYNRIRQASLAAAILIAIAAGTAAILKYINNMQFSVINRAVLTDQSEYSSFKKPYDDKHQQASEFGGIWTGDPAPGEPNPLNIDDLFEREKSLQRKWGDYWPAPPSLEDMLMAVGKKKCLEAGGRWVEGDGCF